MNTKNLIAGDYKKWLLYSFDKRSFKDHYDLYKSLQYRRSSDSVQMTQGVDGYVVAHPEVADELQLSEGQLNDFMHYLVKTYFKTNDIEGLYREKVEQKEKSENHQYLSRKQMSESAGQEVNVKPHYKERLYFNIMLGFSLFVYVFYFGSLVVNAIKFPQFLPYLLIFAVVILLFVLVRFVGHGIFMGIVRGASIRVSKEQYPDLYKIVEDQSKRLGLKSVPEVRIAAGHFNAFVTRFTRTNVLLLFSEVVETSLRGNDNVLKYVIAHELGHIKRSHLSKDKLILPARLIPFLGLAYSRGCEYTCDRIGYTFSPAGSVEGVLIMTTGKEIHSKFDIDVHIKDSVENSGFWSWLSEKFLSHPHHYKRLVEIRNYHKYSAG